VDQNSYCIRTRGYPDVARGRQDKAQSRAGAAAACGSGFRPDVRLWLLGGRADVCEPKRQGLHHHGVDSLSVAVQLTVAPLTHDGESGQPLRFPDAPDWDLDVANVAVNPSLSHHSVRAWDLPFERAAAEQPRGSAVAEALKEPTSLHSQGRSW
jgi:hypothetical protein